MLIQRYNVSKKNNNNKNKNNNNSNSTKRLKKIHQQKKLALRLHVH